MRGFVRRFVLVCLWACFAFFPLGAAGCQPAPSGDTPGVSPPTMGSSTATDAASPPGSSATVSISGSASGEGAAAINAIATFSILGDIVQNVGGHRIHLTTFVGPGGDAHTFEPSPVDATALAKASLVFENGLGFEGWLDRLYGASGSKAKRVAVTDALPLAAEPLGDADPHVWHDAANVITMTLAIRAALVDADPAGSEIYSNNAMLYIDQLRALDNEIQNTVAGIPADRRKLVTSHDTFGYFARRYGFTVVGSVLASASTEAAEPSAAQMARLVADIKAAGVPVLFVENVSNPGLVNRIAEASGVGVGEPLYTDALGEAGSGAETYLAMMRHNIQAIARGLAPVE